MSYWQSRIAKAQDKISRKSAREINKQLRKYYRDAANRCISDFAATYEKLLATVEAGKQPTPADLYKLDKYWEAQAQLTQELQKLGDKQFKLLSKNFELNFFDVYYSLDLPLPPNAAFNTVDSSIAKQLINSIWCADGKSWSQRIWENTEQLAETLNEGLLDTVISGRKSSDLKQVLQERFDVSYGRADALVRTELAHIQTQAAQTRYKDYGIQEVEVWVDEDERTCPICAKHEGERHNISAPMPVPFHPRCRCCMIPVIEID